MKVFEDARNTSGMGLVRSLSLGTPRLWLLQGAVLMALSLSAMVRIPLPFTPVPLTLQVLIVFLAGMMLPGKGSLPAILGYLVLGSLGWPLFSGGSMGLNHFLGTSGGYLLGFVPAAWIVGVGLDRNTGAQNGLRLMRNSAVLSLGLVILYCCGALWFKAVTNVSWGHVWTMAVAPFIVVDVLKIATAYTLFSTVGRKINRWAASDSLESSLD